MKKILIILMIAAFSFGVTKVYTNILLSQVINEVSPSDINTLSNTPIPELNQELDYEKDSGSTLHLPLNKKIICIDAGHGINSYNTQEPIAPNSTQTKIAFSSGTKGKNQTEEELNLSVALNLEEKLLAMGATVYMTRKTHECDITNIGRAEFANQKNADIMIRIHADGLDSSSANGISMLIPSNKYISDQELLTKSRNAGEIILKSVTNYTGAINRGIVERSDLTGFNWSKVPVILLEMGFMTNPQEDAKLETKEYQDKIVAGITNGLLLYFSTQSAQ